MRPIADTLAAPPRAQANQRCRAAEVLAKRPAEEEGVVFKGIRELLGGTGLPELAIGLDDLY